MNTIGVIHYIPESKEEKKRTYRYPELNINYRIRSYITTNIFGLIRIKPSNKNRFGTYVKLLADINKSGENYFGSNIFSG